ncbi:hypothetical protein BKA80DRAFT_285346 [Phyllosticta citrichinensis]
MCSRSASPHFFLWLLLLRRLRARRTGLVNPTRTPVSRLAPCSLHAAHWASSQVVVSSSSFRTVRWFVLRLRLSRVERAGSCACLPACLPACLSVCRQATTASMSVDTTDNSRRAETKRCGTRWSETKREHVLAAARCIGVV